MDALPSILRQNLQTMGISQYFPIQNELIPKLCAHLTGDVVVTSPTGSGKTLTYLVPILVKLLADRKMSSTSPTLRAMVVLPTKDLVRQVEAVAKALALNTGLKVCGFAGMDCARDDSSNGVSHKNLFISMPLNPSFPILDSSLVDLLITTPGKLLELVDDAPGTTLGFLEILILDEVDRMLENDFPDWINYIILKCTRNASECGSFRNIQDSMRLPYLAHLECTNMSERMLTGLQKWLFSATLSDDPSKIAALGLVSPVYYSLSNADSFVDDTRSVETSISLPTGLECFFLVVDGDKKVPHLVWLLKEYSLQRTLVFTRSLEATLKLYKFLVLFINNLRNMAQYEPEKSPFVIEYISSQRTFNERQQILSRLSDPQQPSCRPWILLCTDSMTRGMDLKGIDAVVQYDAPLHIRSFVHRVGRTARAGQAGCAFTFVVSKEARHFKGILAENNLSSVVKKLPLPIRDPYYHSLLRKYHALIKDLSSCD